MELVIYWNEKSSHEPLILLDIVLQYFFMKCILTLQPLDLLGIWRTCSSFYHIKILYIHLSSCFFACHLKSLSMTHFCSGPLVQGLKRGVFISFEDGLCKQLPVFECLIVLSCNNKDDVGDYKNISNSMKWELHNTMANFRYM